jgi:RNA polymerase sigma factor (sigma-70 family)
VIPAGSSGSGARPSAAGRDVMDDFLNRIGRVDLLTPEQERSLGRTVQAGLAARRELEAAAAPAEGVDDADGGTVVVPIDAERERELRRAIVRADRARREFVEANLRLVVSIARNYRTPGVDLADLVQEGNVGLLRAVERFDPDFGVRFSTYATYWIRQAVRQGMSKMGHAIALPDEKRALLLEVRRADERLTQTLGRSPSEAEIATEMGLTVDALYQLRRAELRVVSANSPIGEEGETELIDVLVTPDDPGDDPVDRRELSDALDVAMADLQPRDREILRLRFGFETGEVETLEKVAKHYGITRERVRQLELQAVSRLRQSKSASALLSAVRDD